MQYLLESLSYTLTHQEEEVFASQVSRRKVGQFDFVQLERSTWGNRYLLCFHNPFLPETCSWKASWETWRCHSLDDASRIRHRSPRIDILCVKNNVFQDERQITNKIRIQKKDSRKKTRKGECQHKSCTTSLTSHVRNSNCWKEQDFASSTLQRN